MSYLFIDSEFTDFTDCDLLSFGAVSENGTHEFYVEINDYTPEYRSQFVLDTVMPLMEPAKYGRSLHQAAMDLTHWINLLPGGDIIVVVDYHKDAEFMQMLLHLSASTGCPANKRISYCYITPGFLNMLRERGISKLPTEEFKFIQVMLAETVGYFTIDPRQHHALVDAKANRHGWVKGYEFAKS